MGLGKTKQSGSKQKWYADGLRFECTRCGNCCTGDPGYVWVDREAISRIGAFLGRDDEWLGKKHLRRVGFRYSLTEKPNGDCIFLVREEGRMGCSIHQVRPIQCRTWPFWHENLKTKGAWDRAAESCPGMNHGPLVQLSVIDSRRKGKDA